MAEEDVVGFSPKRVPNERSEEFLIKDDRFQSGWPMKVTMRHYMGLGGRPGWTEIFVEWDSTPKMLIGGVSLEFLRELVQLADERRKFK